MNLKQQVGLWILRYFRFWARLKLAQVNPEIIGITGSAGKTGCKDAVAAVLMDKFQTKISIKANSESGIPLDILGLRPNNFSPFDWLRLMILAPMAYLFNRDKYQKYVVEMGIDSAKSPKNMNYLLTIIKPQIAVWLNVLPVHTYNFPDGVEGIARQKGKLLESLPQSGLGIINRDDPLIRPYITKTQAKVVGLSLRQEPNRNYPEDIHLAGWELTTTQSTVFEFKHQQKRAKVSLAGWQPRELGLSLAAALAVGNRMGIRLNEGTQLLSQNYHQEPGRSSLIEGKNGSLIIDSSYNASPEAVRSLLQLLATVPAKRRLAILGDMNELQSTDEAEKHQEVVKMALGIVDELFLVGPKMRQWGLSQQIESMERKGWVRWHESAKAAGDALASKLSPGDVVLVKGSQNGIFLETAVEIMMQNPDTGEELLCRRGEFWDKMRNVIY